MLSVSVNSSNGNAAESVFRNGFGYTNKTLSDWILRGPTGDATYFADYIAIGCQPQWGASGYAVTFPIAFNVVYNVLSIPQTTASTSNAYWGRFYITALTKNGFNVSDTGAGSNRWIAIGSAQPQWGFEETETKTIAFPISFESIKYVFLSKIYGPASGGADTVAYNFFRKSLTGVSFDYAYTRNWLAIGGKQPQWGTNRTNGIYSFPIPFTEALCCFGGGEAGSGYYDNASAYSNTQVRVYSDGSSRFVSWIAIGA